MTMPALDPRTNLSRKTTVLLAVTIAVGLLHHADHVLRVDHSGWPFRADVNPFTFSLLAYPILLFALFGRRAAPWLRFAAVAFVTIATLAAHTLIETPRMQYAMWALNHSIDPQEAHVQNALHIASPEMGVTAMALSMTLNVLVVASTVAMAGAMWAARR